MSQKLFSLDTQKKIQTKKQQENIEECSPQKVEKGKNGEGEKQREKNKSKQPDKLPSQTFINLQLSTWLKNSHNLYDYQQPQPTLQNPHPSPSLNPSPPNTYPPFSQPNQIPNLNKILSSALGSRPTQEKYLKKEYQFSMKTQRLWILRNQKYGDCVVLADPWRWGCGELVGEGEGRGMGGEIEGDRTDRTDRDRWMENIVKDKPELAKYKLISDISITPNFQTKKLQFTFNPLSPPPLTPTPTPSPKTPKSLNPSSQPLCPYIDNPPPVGLVVQRQETLQKQPKGHLLSNFIFIFVEVGHVIYFGKVRYLVREVKVDGMVERMDREYYYEECKDGVVEVNGDRCEGNQYKEKRQQLSEKTQAIKLQNNPTTNPTPQPKQPPQTATQPQNPTQCRICYSPQTPTNRLINICRCTGSMKYTHIQCLKQWIDMKAVVRNRDHCISIERIECEICKEEIPICVGSGDGVGCEEIVLIDRPKVQAYLLLQKIASNPKNILILKSLPPQGLTLGRDNSCYIKLPDITTSRVHAQIKYLPTPTQSHGFYLFDRGSKFGTMVVEAERPLSFEVGKCWRAVQIGRSLVGVGVRRNVRGVLEGLG